MSSDGGQREDGADGQQQQSAVVLDPSLPCRLLSHSFLDCLRDRVASDVRESAAASLHPSDTAAMTTTADAASERFALIVVNGEVGEFLQPLWRSGQRARHDTTRHDTTRHDTAAQRTAPRPLVPLVSLLLASPCQLPCACARLCCDFLSQPPFASAQTAV